MAKELGRLDIGQSVTVKGRATLAVEAIEGTDECIRRAGQLCAPGFTVVKVAKPKQDMRFDVPTIGLGTLETMVEAGASCLAIEAGRTIIIDQPEVIRFADRHRLAIVAVDDGHVPEPVEERRHESGDRNHCATITVPNSAQVRTAQGRRTRRFQSTSWGGSARFFVVRRVRPPALGSKFDSDAAARDHDHGTARAPAYWNNPGDDVRRKGKVEGRRRPATDRVRLPQP